MNESKITSILILEKINNKKYIIKFTIENMSEQKDKNSDEFNKIPT